VRKTRKKEKKGKRAILRVVEWRGFAARGRWCLFN